MKISPFGLVLLTLCFSIVCFGQSALDSTKFPLIKKSDVNFDIVLKEKKVKNGGAIELETLIQNSFLGTIELPYDRYDGLDFYSVEIFDSKGDLVRRKDKITSGVPQIRSWTALELVANEKFNSNLRLDRFYNLPVGEYSIKVSLRVFERIKREEIVVSSNSQTLKIVE